MAPWSTSEQCIHFEIAFFISMFGSAANKTIDLLSDSSVGLSVMTHHRGTTNVEFGIRPNVSFEPGLLGPGSMVRLPGRGSPKSESKL